jgi:hypothetical protein
MSQQPLTRFLKLGPPGSNSIRQPVVGVRVEGLEAPGPASVRSAGAAGDGLLITKELLLGNHRECLRVMPACFLRVLPACLRVMPACLPACLPACWPLVVTGGAGKGSVIL